MKIDHLLNSPYLEEQAFLDAFIEAREEGLLKLKPSNKERPEVNGMILQGIFNKRSKIVCNFLDEHLTYLELTNHLEAVESHLLILLYNLAVFKANLEPDYDLYTSMSLSQKLTQLVSLGIDKELITYLNDRSLNKLAKHIHI